MFRSIFKFYFLLAIGLFAISGTAFAEPDWFPFRAEIRGEAMQWKEDTMRVSRQVGIFEVAIPFVGGLYGGPSVSGAKLELRNGQPDFIAPYQIGFGAVLGYSDIALGSLKLNVEFTGDGQRQISTSTRQYAIGSTQLDQTTTTYHLTGVARLPFRQGDWSIIPQLGVVGDRIDRIVTEAGFTNSSTSWSGMQPTIGIAFNRNFGHYYSGILLSGGTNERVGITVTIGQDERK